VLFTWNYTYVVVVVITYYNDFFFFRKKDGLFNLELILQIRKLWTTGEFRKDFRSCERLLLCFFSSFFRGIHLYIICLQIIQHLPSPNNYDRLLGNKFHRCIRLIKFPVERFSSFSAVQTRWIRKSFPKIIIGTQNMLIYNSMVLYGDGSTPVLDMRREVL